MKSVSMVFGPLLILTACSGGVRESQVASAIDEEIKEKTCLTLENKRVPDWPLRLNRPLGYQFAEGDRGLDPILAAMQRAGHLAITRESSRWTGFAWTPIVDVIMPTEEAKTWWDVQDGFCVGTKGVAEIQEWTEPGDAGGIQVIQVKYTWRLKDVPSWAKRPEFDSIPGMATPIPGVTVLQKTNKGWKSAKAFAGS